MSLAKVKPRHFYFATQGRTDTLQNGNKNNRRYKINTSVRRYSNVRRVRTSFSILVSRGIKKYNIQRESIVFWITLACPSREKQPRQEGKSTDDTNESQKQRRSNCSTESSWLHQMTENGQINLSSANKNSKYFALWLFFVGGIVLKWSSGSNQK